MRAHGIRLYIPTDIARDRCCFSNNVRFFFFVAVSPYRSVLLNRRRPRTPVFIRDSLPRRTRNGGNGNRVDGGRHGDGQQQRQRTGAGRRADAAVQPGQHRDAHQTTPGGRHGARAGVQRAAPVLPAGGERGHVRARAQTPHHRRHSRPQAGRPVQRPRVRRRVCPRDTRVKKTFHSVYGSIASCGGR